MSTEIWRSQNNFSGGVISEKMFGRIELTQYQDSVAELLNFKVMPHGGITRRAGTKYVCEVKDSTKAVRVLPFEFSADTSYVIEAGNRYFRFVRDGVQILDTGVPVELVTPYLEAELFELKFVQSADVMWITHRNHQPRKLIRYSDVEWYLEPVSFIDGPYLPINTTAMTMVASAATGTVTLTASEVFTVTNVTSVDSTTSEVTTASRHKLVSGQAVTIAGVGGATNANGTWAVTVTSPTTFTIPADTSAQSYTSGGTVTGGNAFAATDVGRQVRIWYDTDAKWAWGSITGYTNPSVVTVDVVENNFPIVATLKWKLGKWSDTTGWPAAVMLYETRLCYGGAPESLQDLDFSQTDRFAWFQVAADETLLASDALGWSLYSNKVDDVVWMMPARAGLAVGTSGGAWIITGADGKDSPLAPNSVNAKKHTAVGSDPFLTPAQIDNAVIFVDKGGKKIYEFAFVWAEDSYRAPDLTILADHLFSDTTVKDMDVQGTNKIIWVVLADGNLIGLTYMRAEEVIAWHTHSTDGTFESVCAVTETRDEVPYFVVKRNINGSDVKYIEFMEADWTSNDSTESYFVDSGITFTNGPASTTITGLDHLEGEAVSCLADGRVVSGLTVVGGEVELEVAALVGSVGLNFFSDVQSLPIELAQEATGSTIGRIKDIGKLGMRITKSYGCKIGRTFETLEEVQFNEQLIFGEAPALFSGEKTIDKIEGQPATDIRLCLRQDLPLPFTLNSLNARMLITED